MLLNINIANSRKSITNTLQAMSIAEAAVTEASSIGSAGSLAARQRHNGLQPYDDELTGKIF